MSVGIPWEALSEWERALTIDQAKPDLEAYRRIEEWPASRLNAVAGAVVDVIGFTPLDVRYAIAVRALECLRDAGE